MKKAILLLALAAVLVHGQKVRTQTDWIGGPGTQGPVINWGTGFFEDSLLDYSWSGELRLDLAFDPKRHEIDGDFQGCNSIYPADIDGDGDTDLVGGSMSSPSEIVWWENKNGIGTSWKKHVLSGNASYVSAADIDGDGDIDILGTDWDQGSVHWWENTDGSGGVWTVHTVEGEYIRGNSASIADINGDGHQDILASSNYVDMSVWINEDGSGTTWSRHHVTSYLATQAACTGDIDGDGDLDIIASADSIGMVGVFWWANDGTGTGWTTSTILEESEDAGDVNVSDMDGDGDIDVIVARMDANELVWFENSGEGSSWTEHLIAGGFGEPTAVYAADLDGDGDMDVAGSAQTSNEMAWFENRGTTWAKHLLESGFTQAATAMVADMDGDGSPDILGTSYYRGIVNWYKPFLIPLAGDITSSILDTGGSPTWGSIDWSAEFPLGTSVSLMVRSSTNTADMGAWSDTLNLPCSLAGILEDGDRYMQYRVVMHRMNSDLIPVLEDISVSFSTDVSEATPITYHLYPPAPNPAPGTAMVRFDLPLDGHVRLTVHDMTGRVVTVPYDRESVAGVLSIEVTDLLPGVYLVRMEAGFFSGTERLVMIGAGGD